MQALDSVLGVAAGFGPPCPPCGVAADLGGLGRVRKAIVRAVLPASKLRSCAGCSGRFRVRDLFEVGDDDLTYFEGDDLCRECARGHVL